MIVVLMTFILTRFGDDTFPDCNVVVIGVVIDNCDNSYFLPYHVCCYLAAELRDNILSGDLAF